MTDLTEEKARLRRIALKARKAAHLQHSEQAAKQLARQFMADDFLCAFLRAGQIIGGYVATGYEIDPTDLLKQAVDNGIALALPVTDKASAAMAFKPYQFGDRLVKGDYGILEPSAEADFVIPQLMLLPVLAFDEAGNRLGRGGGHYDRYLKKMRRQHKTHDSKTRNPEFMAIGLAYEAQLMPHLPCQAQDEPLNAIITPAGIIRPTEKERA